MPVLSILMPVRNVADVLEEYLPELLDITQGYDCEIIIGDNASDDNTQEVCESFGDKIKYVRNEKNLGGSGNVLKLLSLAKGKYSICIGKNRIFEKEIFGEFYNMLMKSDYDFISVNSPGRVTLPSKEYCDINEILDDLGWHLTLVSAMIFHKRVLQDLSQYEKYVKSELVHAAILYHCVLKGARVYFDERPIVKGFAHKNSMSQWLGEIIVYMAKMVDLMVSFGGNIKRESRFKWIMDLSAMPQHNWFTADFYKRMVRDYGLGFWQCFKYRKYFKYFSQIPFLKVLLIVLCEKLKLFIFNKTKDGKTRKVRIFGGLMRYSDASGNNH